MINMMSFDQVLEGISELASHNGFYARLLDKIQEMNEEQLGMLRASWDRAFSDMVDFILWIER